MLGGADNPNGELLSYIIGADNHYIKRAGVAGIRARAVCLKWLK